MRSPPAPPTAAPAARGATAAARRPHHPDFAERWSSTTGKRCTGSTSAKSARLSATDRKYSIWRSVVWRSIGETTKKAEISKERSAQFVSDACDRRGCRLDGKQYALGAPLSSPRTACRCRGRSRSRYHPEVLTRGESTKIKFIMRAIPTICAALCASSIQKFIDDRQALRGNIMPCVSSRRLNRRMVVSSGRRVIAPSRPANSQYRAEAYRTGLLPWLDPIDRTTAE